MSNMVDDLEKVLGAVAQLCAAEGLARELAVLALSRPTIEQTHYDNYANLYAHIIRLEVPISVYEQLGQKVQDVEGAFENLGNHVLRRSGAKYDDDWIQAFRITSELTVDEHWREKARTFVSGEG